MQTFAAVSAKVGNADEAAFDYAIGNVCIHKK